MPVLQRSAGTLRFDCWLGDWGFAVTVIAWDGISLCADRRACNGTAINTTTKAHRIEFSESVYLAAYSGSAATGEEMLEWFARGGDVEKFPQSRRTASGDDWAALIVIAPDKTILRYEATPYPVRFEQKKYAAGGGADFARMAMHLGHSARDAVLLTCELDSGCGNGVDEVTF
jgi:ATP-dependent protease HslVU (ClpYQ) peptidase subunit